MEFNEEELADFVEESIENLDALDQAFMELEKNPSNREILAQIFRAVHTMKGSAGFLGMAKLEKFCHAGEEVLDKARKGDLAISHDHITLLLSYVDVLRRFVAEVETNKQELAEDLSQYFQQLEATCAGNELDLSSLGLKESAETTSDLKDSARPEAPVAIEEEIAAIPEAHEDDWGEELEEEPVPVAQTKEVALSPSALPVKAESEGPAVVAKHAETSVRVDVHLLDKLMNLVGELVLTRNQLTQISSSLNHAALNNSLGNLSLVTSELQEGIMKTRMQPVGLVIGKFNRVVRDLAVSVGKKVNLSLSGEDTELDRTVMEAIRDPLTHIIRNAVDHGIESPEDREKAGKNPTGHLHIQAMHEGGQVIIEVSDDGKGLHRELIQAKAVERGLVSASQAQAMSDKDIYSFIFEAGFSTAAAITNISGRGVGLDVVRSNISSIGGQVDLDSKPGEGSVFRMQIPLTLAIIPALTIKSAGIDFAIPQVSVLELILLDDKEAHGIEHNHGSEVYRLRDRLLPVVRLNRIIHQPEVEREESYIVVLSNGDQGYGLLVDEVVESGEIVVKPLSDHLKNCKAFVGATVLGNGDISLILDVPGMASMVNMQARSVNKSVMDKVVSRTKMANTLLVFHIGGSEVFGVQLSQVERMVEFQLQDIECVSGRDAMQYRGGILPLIYIKDYLPVHQDVGEDKAYLIVFRIMGREVGLVVKDIVDTIVMEGTLDTDVIVNPYVIGSMTLNEKITILLDMSSIVSQTFPEWFSKMALAAGGGPARVLYVDDSPFYLKVVGRICKDNGLDYLGVDSGGEVLKLLDNGEHFDILLVDLEMPEMDGVTLIRRIRKNAKFDNLPIVVLSALTGGQDKDFAEESGIDAYQVKLDKEALLLEIRRILAVRKKDIA